VKKLYYIAKAYGNMAEFEAKIQKRLEKVEAMRRWQQGQSQARILSTFTV